MKPELLLENQICHSLYCATNALIRAYRPLLDTLDLTYPQYLVMLALWEEDGVIIKKLVERTRLDAGTLTPILKRLQAKGIVELKKSVQDSRQKYVHVSEQGKLLQEQARSIPGTLSCQISMNREDAQNLKRLTEQLFAQLTSVK